MNHWSVMESRLNHYTEAMKASRPQHGYLYIPLGSYLINTQTINANLIARKDNRHGSYTENLRNRYHG